MATRIETILLRARDTLADPEGERWSDARLIRLLDEGQQDVAKHTKILKGEADIYMAEGQAIYQLPSDVWLLTRAAFNNCLIEFYSHAQLDELVRTHAIESSQTYYERNSYGTYGNTEISNTSYCWETETGTSVQALIFDRRNMDEIRVFPIPSEGMAANSYLFETDDPEFDGAELLGVTTDVTGYSFNSVFGVVSDLYDPQIEVENFLDVYGVLTAVNESEGVVHLWYIRMPTAVTTVDDDLEIPTMFDTALKHYVVSNAFDDDYDTRFAEKAQKAAALYEREVGIIQETQSKDGVRSSQVNTTDYRGAFS